MPFAAESGQPSQARNATLASLLIGRLWGSRNFCRTINFAKAVLSDVAEV